MASQNVLSLRVDGILVEQATVSLDTTTTQGAATPNWDS